MVVLKIVWANLTPFSLQLGPYLSDTVHVRRLSPSLATRPPPSQTIHRASEALGRLKRCKLAHAFLQEYSYKKLKLAQLLGRHGVFLTCVAAADHRHPHLPERHHPRVLPDPRHPGVFPLLPPPQGEKDAVSAQKLGQLQPFLAVYPQECTGQLASLGTT
jgi:hypothetical protein